MKKRQILFFVLDFLIVAVAFLIAATIKPATKRIYIPTYIDKVLVFLVLWILISIMGNKYKIPLQNKFSDIISNLFRNNFVILGLVSFMLFAFKSYQYSRLIVLGTLFFAFLLEFLLSMIFYFHTKLKKETDFSEKIEHKPVELKIDNKFLQEKITFEHLNPIENEEETAYFVLRKKYLKKLPKILDWLDNFLPLKSIPKNKTVSFNTSTIYNIENFEENSQQLFINLHKVNDFQRINKFFIQINKNLAQNGIYIGTAITNKEVYKNFINKYHSLLGNFLYFFYFIFHRIMPKLNGFKEIYFALTKGKNRALSKAEVLGRLYFCGFQVHQVTEIDEVLHFIAIKKTKPREDKNPSYGPLFKMKRVGKDGKPIYVYKFRTMHPYSEYLQHYLVEHNGYDEKGKIKDDFRITTWGKFLRKYWLDELPQLINFFRGDLSLVGVRPVSERFLKEYPKEIREKRSQYKPGCIPPYVAYRMQRVDDYIKSEIIYLNQKEKHPIWTDIKVFFIAIYNILTNRIRSK